jgi:hypothetical protein
MICGATPNATLKVTVDITPVKVQAVPVVIVTVPDMSLPAIATVGAVQ